MTQIVEGTATAKQTKRPFEVSSCAEWVVEDQISDVCQMCGSTACHFYWISLLFGLRDGDACQRGVAAQ